MASGGGGGFFCFVETTLKIHLYFTWLVYIKTSGIVLLQEYKPAKNLAFNEEVKKLMAEGKKIYHLGFGQV